MSQSQQLHSKDYVIDAVYFAQTHVLEPEHPYFRLVGEKNTLIKVHVLASKPSSAPEVKVELDLNDEKLSLPLTGPDMLPQEFNSKPGEVVHRFEDCYTATIPGKWIQKGLKVTILAGDVKKTYDNLLIGPPLRLNTIAFDIHYFDYEDADWPEEWVEEIAIRRPLTAMKVQRIKQLLFPEVVISPTNNQPAVRCKSTDDYEKKMGNPIVGHQGTAFRWTRALQEAGGQKRLSLYYINIGNLRAGGFAEPLHGCGCLARYDILHHEFGHALDVEDLSPTEEPLYPYRGAMHGIDKSTTGGYHIGPTWGYDHRVGVSENHPSTPLFINPVVSAETNKNKPGEWKSSPLRGGAGREDEAPDTFNMFSDWSVRKKQVFLERTLLKWKGGQDYLMWNDYWDSYRKPFKSDGVNCPIENDVEVFSILVSVSAVTPDANFIYPVIGPYRSGLIETFDPNNGNDRKKAGRIMNYAKGWDVCLRITQGGSTRLYMMPFSWDPEDNPLDVESLQHRALNLPVRDGVITKAELLLTPMVNINGLPESPKILYSSEMGEPTGRMVKSEVDFGCSEEPKSI